MDAVVLDLVFKGLILDLMGSNIVVVNIAGKMKHNGCVYYPQRVSNKPSERHR